MTTLRCSICDITNSNILSEDHPEVNTPRDFFRDQDGEIICSICKYSIDFSFFDDYTVIMEE